MNGEIKKGKVLFVCTHNSARSQMAEAFLRSLYGNEYEAYSAGTEPTSVHPLAVQVMKEIGIDISSQKAKSVSEFVGREMDDVVTVCDHAKETCPFFPYGKRFHHQSFTDPAGFSGSREEKLAHFRQVRETIRSWVEKQFGAGRRGSAS